MVNDEELRRVYDQFTTVWKLFKGYVGIQQEDDARWQQFVNEADSIAKTYDNGAFIRDLLLATTQELERQSKKGGAENAETQ